jgi:integrase
MEIIAEAKKKSKSKADRDFPLWLHPTGRWCRKIAGKFHYFGRDKDEALTEWLRVKDDLLANRPRPVKDGSVTVADLCNQFLTSKRNKIDTREVTPRTWQSYHRSCSRLVAIVGGSRSAASLGPGDFEAIRSALARARTGKARSAVTLRGDVLNIRILFKYGFTNELLARPARFGDGFNLPKKEALRRARQEREAAHGKRLFRPDELRKVIEAADQPLRAMILLGVNAAFGASDCSALPETAIDWKAGWINFPRPKTAVERRCKLWPETVKALREAIAERDAMTQKALKNGRPPVAPEDAGLVFLTRCRQRWVRVAIPTSENPQRKVSVADAVSCEFAKLLEAQGVKRPRLGFYALRHTFRTVADNLRDDPAVDRVMGHTTGRMADDYVEEIEDERLERVAAHVRAWLFPKRKQRVK